MNPIRDSSTQHATPSGPRSIRTPSASSTSALPHALDAARFPCLATRPPAAAVTIALTVEMLKLLERSPPVPTTSIASGGTVTRTASARSADAQPEIWAVVTPGMGRAGRRAPSCAGVASPAITDTMAERASSRVSVRPPAMATRASRASNEVLQHAHAVGGHHGFGMELHGLERKRSVPERHHNTVVAPSGDDQVRRQRSLVDHERVVARRFGRIRDPCEDAFAVVPYEGGLAVPRLRGTNDRSAERDRGALEPQADTERRDAELRPLAHESGRTARDLGTTRSGRDDKAIGTRGERGREGRVVGAKHRDLRAERAECLRKVVRERVVVIDQQHPGGHRAGSAPSTSSIARKSARALARVSRSSAAGSESATIPAPAWMRHTPSAMTAVRIPMHVSMRPSNPR